MERIGIVLVDDHPLYRRGLRAALVADPEFEVLGEGATAGDALSLCQVVRPQVLLLDLNLPDMSGVDATRRIAAECPDTAVVALTAHREDALMLAVAEAGAKGYLLKEATDREIASAVKSVAAGGTAFDPAVTQAFLRRSRIRAGGSGAALTDREKAVLAAAAKGLTNRQIGHALGISERTAQAHLARVFEKLDVASRTEAVTLALRQGLIELEEPQTD